MSKIELPHIASATRGMGNVVVFNFAGSGVCPGQTSYFFGLTSATTMPSIENMKIESPPK